MMLVVDQLTCERGYRPLYEVFSFSADAGELIQIVGANGAGKSTLLRILAGLYLEYEGEVSWDISDGVPPLYLGHKPGVRDTLTAAENLAWLCQLQNASVTRQDITSALNTIGLAGYEDEFCGQLSEGQRKRVSLARLLILKNPVWLLDEPFSAIDPAGIALLEEAIETHRRSGGLILYSSHQPVSLADEQRVLDLNHHQRSGLGQASC